MKTSRCCSKCHNNKIFHATEVLDRASGNAAMPMAIGRSGAIHARDFGIVEAYVCVSCGFTEFYVRNPSELEHVIDDTGGLGVGQIEEGIRGP